MRFDELYRAAEVHACDNINPPGHLNAILSEYRYFHRLFLSLVSLALQIFISYRKDMPTLVVCSGQEFAGEVEDRISPLFYDSVLVCSGQGFFPELLLLCQ